MLKVTTNFCKVKLVHLSISLNSFHNANWSSTKILKSWMKCFLNLYYDCQEIDKHQLNKNSFWTKMKKMSMKQWVWTNIFDNYSCFFIINNSWNGRLLLNHAFNFENFHLFVSLCYSFVSAKCSLYNFENTKKKNLHSINIQGVPFEKA